MSLRSFFLYIFFACALIFGTSSLYAQSSRADSIIAANRRLQESRDSAIKVREDLAEANRKKQEAYRDSMANARDVAMEAQRKANEAMRDAREKRMDSLRDIRQARADSLADIRKYKESKYYKDSVTYVRKSRLDSIQAVRKAYSDSLKEVRKARADSISYARKVIMDSVHAVQKHRSDSLASIRKYKEGKRYRDSVEVVKKLRGDSVKLVRKGHSDSLLSARKKVTDSFARIRKMRTDSLAAVRKIKTDSLTANKKVKADSLAKAKDKRLKNQKVKEQDKEKKQQLAFELKINKKHQAYSNESMMKKRWGLPRQVVQNSFTRYNYFFNADRKMDEAILNMQRVRKDNYDSLLALFPFDPDRDSAMIASDMDSIIRKVSVGIQIHDPRTKWGDDLYLILGQAYFYKGNYSDAASAFRYILSLKDKKKKKKNSSERPKTSKTLSIAQPDKKGMLAFLEHRSVNNEAILWLARTFTQMKQEGNAESVLDLLEIDPNFPKSMQGRLALEKAFIALHERDDKGAVEQLSIVAKDNNIPNVIRMRAAFVNGQLLMRRNDYAAAATQFNQVIDLYPKIEMDFYARKNLAYSVMLSGGDQKDAIAALKKVLNDGKYAAYYEQVYFILGRLSENGGNNEDAIAYFNKGLSSSKSTRKQKAISFAALGNIYYKTGDYTNAKNAYDSSVAMAQAAPNDSLVLVAMKRSNALNSITGPMGVIHMQDSLLALSALSEKEQRAEVRRHIRRLEQAKTDSAFRAENTALNNAQNASQSNTNSGNTNTYANWYFANPALMQSGMNEFKRKWGNRALADNWQRSIGTGFGNNNNNNTAKNETDNDVAPDLDEKGLPTEESLLAYIPSNAQMKDDAQGKIRRAYMDVANAYVKDLEDYPPALHTLDTFDKRYPKHEYQAEALYLRYLVATRENKFKEAQGYAGRILQEYQDTKFADLVRPSESGTNIDTNQLTNMVLFYDDTYNLLMQRDYQTVLTRSRQGKRQFGNPNYNKRFTIMEGAALVGISDYKHADSLLNMFILQYPSDTLRYWADALLKYMKNNKPAEIAPPSGTVDTTNAGAAKTAAGTTTNPTVAANPALSAPAGTITKDGIAMTPPPSRAVSSLPVSPVPPPSSAPTQPVLGSQPPTQQAPATNYTYQPKEEHFVAFVFGPMETRAMGVKAGISDFNTFKYSDKHLSTDVNMLQLNRGMITIKSFKNAQEAQAYVNAVKNEPKLFQEYKTGDYQWILLSSGNFDKLMTSKDMDEYLKFYTAKYK